MRMMLRIADAGQAKSRRIKDGSLPRTISMSSG